MTAGLTSRHPMARATARIGIPKTTTRKLTLWERYGEACQPEIAMPTTTSPRKTSPMMLVHGCPGIGNVLGGMTPRSVSLPQLQLAQEDRRTR